MGCDPTPGKDTGRRELRVEVVFGTVLCLIDLTGQCGEGGVIGSSRASVGNTGQVRTYTVVRESTNKCAFLCLCGIYRRLVLSYCPESKTHPPIHVTGSVFPVNRDPPTSEVRDVSYTNVGELFTK